MRAFIAALALLAACGQTDDPAGNDQGLQQAASGGDDRVMCAIGGARRFERVCTVERSSASEGPILILRAPDGGFRRLLVTTDGRGVIAADGAESAAVETIGGDLIEVAIGSDRYRLPATVEDPR